MTLRDEYEFRSKLVDYLVTDVVGPSAEDEVLNEAPLERYVTGILYPQREGSVVAPDPDSDHDTVDEDSDVQPDPPVSLANRRYPSSMGLTFAVDTSAARAISVKIGAGQYEELPGAQLERPDGPRRRFGGEGSGSRWLRRQRSWTEPAVTIDRPGDQTIELEEHLDLFVRVRPPDDDGCASVTVVVVNRKVVSGLRDGAAYFQVRLEVQGTSSAPVFVPRRAVALATSDPTFARTNCCTATRPCLPSATGVRPHGPIHGADA